MDHQERLEKLKVSLEKAKTTRTRAEANLEQLEKQKAEITQEMTMLGVTPETIEPTIKALEAEIEDLLSSAEKMIPEGY